MAYREFHVEKIYAAPDISILERGLNKTADNISNMFMNIAAAKRKKDLEADQYKVDLGQGSFENDNKLLYQLTNELTNEGKQRLKSGQGLDADYNTRLNNGLLLKANSKTQYDRWMKDLDRLDKRANEDAYYDPTYDEALLKEATHGKDNEVNAFNRGDRLDQAEAMLGQNPKGFKMANYTADYVKTLGKTEIEKTTGNPNSTSTIFNGRVFWDKKTMVPMVTDRHAVEFLNSRPDVKKYIEAEVNDELDNEIATMKNAKDPRTEWMNGLSDVAIKNELVRDPSRNIINSTDFGVRVRKRAAQKLEDADDINSKVSYEQKPDKANTGGLYNNGAIAHSDTFYNENVGVSGNVDPRVIEAGRMGQNAAPGGILMINKGTNIGKPLTLDFGSKSVFNINTGKTEKVRGSSQFNLTGYQAQIYDREGKPFMIEAANQEEFNKAIANIPYSKMVNLDPDMKIALKGYSIDKAKMLNDVRASTETLNQKLANARQNGSSEDIIKIESQLAELDEFKTMLNGDEDDYTDEDVVTAGIKNGITGIRINQLVKGDPADLDKINVATQGLNLNDRNKWSPDMNNSAALLKKRWNEAQAAGFKDAPTKKTRGKAAPKAAVPKGNVTVVSPDGKVGYIPADQLEDALSQGYKKSD